MYELLQHFGGFPNTQLAWQDESGTQRFTTVAALVGSLTREARYQIFGTYGDFNAWDLAAKVADLGLKPDTPLMRCGTARRSRNLSVV